MLPNETLILGLFSSGFLPIFPVGHPAHDAPYDFPRHPGVFFREYGMYPTIPITLIIDVGRALILLISCP
jgi:hypothetical protein